MKKYIFVSIIILVLVAIFIIKSQMTKTGTSGPIISSPISHSPVAISSSTTNINALAEPISEFKTRITKKTFGMYIAPTTSPVQPERFSGYHLGDDVEYTDTTTDVPVSAINDGIITYSGWVSGYGGVLILKTDINGSAHSVLYGHLRPSSLPAIGTNFKKSAQMSVLGTGYSNETDGERRHLHFAILSDNRIDLKGYVSSKSQLSGWLDPLSFY